MKILPLIICLTLLTSQSPGQVKNSKIDKTDLKTFVRILASDSLAGRGTGTEGQRKAERFIAKRFQELGLNTHSQNDYLERFKLTETYWGKVYIKTQNKTLENFENMVFQGSAIQNEEIEREVVFGGLGTEEELNQINCEGRIVFVFLKNLRATHDISTRLEKRNAVGLIAANPENENQFESLKRTFKDYASQKRLSLKSDTIKDHLFARWDKIKNINTIAITNSEIKNLTGLSTKQLTRLIDTRKIAQAPISRLKVKFEKIQNEIESTNVIGILRGKSSKAIVVSAHYDHLGKHGKEYFPGADDNASGTAALLELAEHFSGDKNLPYSIIFIATSGEEAGLLGSRYHVSQPGFKSENIICNLNLDMIARIDDQHSNGKYLYCIGTDQSLELHNIVKEADSLFDDCTFDFSLNDSKDPSGIFTRSDQYNFYKKGIPAIHFFSGLHADYHKSTDTIDKINFENLERRVKQISTVVELLQRDGLKINSQ